MVTIFAGGMLGVGLGALREIRDRGFRTREQVRSVLATECLALVPLLADRKRVFSGWRALALPQPRQGEFASSLIELAQRSICSAPKIMRTIVDSPSSPYAEAIRSIKLTVDLNSQAKRHQDHWLDIVLTKRGQIQPRCGDGGAHRAGWGTCHFSGL